MDMTFRYRFEAGHRLTGASSAKCQTPHGHTWWVEVSLRRKDGSLDSQGMLGEFGAAKKWLKTWIDETLDHSFFHHWQDPLLPALREHIEGFRGLPFPEDPTTEWLVYLISRKVRAHLAAEGDREPQKFLELQQVKVEETPTNSMLWRATLDGTMDQLLRERLAHLRGWWDEADPLHRGIEPVKP